VTADHRGEVSAQDDVTSADESIDACEDFQQEVFVQAEGFSGLGSKAPASVILFCRTAYEHGDRNAAETASGICGKRSKTVSLDENEVGWSFAHHDP
jgi:hypothetical protein